VSIDLNVFKGLTPYASELFGIYQPLLGWKAKRKLRWIGRHQAALLHGAVEKLRELAPPRATLLATPRPIGPNDLMSHAIQSWAQSETGRALQAAAVNFVNRTKRIPEATDWKAIAGAAGFDRVLTRVARSQTVPSTTKQRAMAPSLTQESAIAGALQHLADVAPSVLNQVLNLDAVMWPLTPAVTDPLATFDPATQRAILSPIGMVNVFREYFFELDTFLGPAVGHVWVSPGGTLEVYEVHTRRTLEERMTEIGQTSITKVDREASETEEIADKVAKQNSTDIDLGISAEGGMDTGIYHASASASFGMKQNQQVAQETAHKRARSQSEKISNEIRREFKTSFRTVVETTDTSSRRYILQNTTDKLVNYELRRKMRRVGVQLQHIGTQLCWQVFVDEPGLPLGVGVLVHAAAPDELVSAPPPEAPPPLESKKEQVMVNFAFEPLDANARDDGEDEDYKDGHDVHEPEGEAFIRDRKTVTANPPANGYVLQSATVLSFTGSDPEEGQPTSVANVCTVTGAQEFELRLTYVNFNDQPSINFSVELIWNPPKESAETLKAYEDAKKLYNEASAKAAHTAYVKEVRERINQAGLVPKRDTSDLRAEERTVIFRRLIRDLSEIKNGPEPHLMSELIRSIFDIDKMLYYVSQEWWRPRTHKPQRLGEKLQLADADRVTWGGEKQYGRHNYYITEESQPAPMGDSLGWLLQLDGDPHRNAFLNSPWVKAVLPIRPGREAAALNWLQQAHVEGSSDLDALYGGNEPELKGMTIGEAAMSLAEEVTSSEGRIENTLATETVFERGFDPLEGGFRATGVPFEVFDQWVEVLPTDQVVAVEYLPPPVVPVP